jgi:transketolase
MRNAFAAFVTERVKQGAGDNVVVLTGDLGFSVLEPLREALGPRFINAGVAEASMTTMAAAMAADGFKVFTYSITPFATFRCLEQIRNDICYHNLDVTVVGVGAGYGYGTLGPTHHAIEDLAALWSIPNLAVFNPADVREAKATYAAAWELSGPKYLRIGKGGEGELDSAPMPELNKVPVVTYAEGSELTVIVTGNVLSEVLPAVRQYSATGVKTQLLSCPWLKPFPTESLLSAITSPHVVIVEELSPYGSFAAQVAKEMLVRDPQRWKSVRTLSAPDAFAKRVGGMAFQRQAAGLDTASIFEFLSRGAGSDRGGLNVR